MEWLHNTFFMITPGFLLEKRKNPYSLEGNHPEQHAGPQRIIRLLSDCSVFIAQKFGDQKKRKNCRGCRYSIGDNKRKRCTDRCGCPSSMKYQPYQERSENIYGK